MSGIETTVTARTAPVHSWKWGDVLVLLLGLGTAIAAHISVFDGWAGARAGAGGLVVGMVTAFICTRWRLSFLTSLWVLCVGYVLGGTVAALPDTAMWTVVPTLDTLKLLLIGSVSAWKDMLTVKTPVIPTGTVTLVPYMSGLLAAFTSLQILWKTRYRGAAILPVLLLLILGLLWGSHQMRWALPTGVAAGLILLVWVATGGRKAAASSSTLVALPQASPRRVGAGIIGALLVLTLALGAGAGAFVLQWRAETSRFVLRDYISPPVDLREYTSPAVHFRSWRTTDAQTPLLRAKGIKGGGRLRLAALDSYDGTVFQLSDAQTNGGFVHVSKVISQDALPASLTASQVDVEVLGYKGNWIPAGVRVMSLEFTSERAEQLSGSVHHSEDLSTFLTTNALAEGDSYTIETVLNSVIADAVVKDRPLMKGVPQAEDVNVPAIVGKRALEMTEGASAGFDQVRMIAQTMQADGFYSDGSDGNSRAGHRSDRLEAFLSNKAMIGDDDQYAPAMALMLRSLGVPSRVVIGFVAQPSRGEEQTFTGKDVHMWVEVPFEGVGWVPFDPTPPENQTVRTEAPKPKPKPNPQVLQPPEPPEEPTDAPAEEFIDPKDEDVKEDSGQPWRLYVAGAAGVVSLLLLPFLAIVLFKAMRAWTRRRRGSAGTRAMAAWDELLDRARDLGVRVPEDLPRPLQADIIEEKVWGRSPTGVEGFHDISDTLERTHSLAEGVDASVFAFGQVDDQEATVLWENAGRIIGDMRKSTRWRRRLGALVSVRTFTSRWRRRESPQPKETTGQVEHTAPSPTKGRKTTGVSTRALQGGDRDG